MVQTCRKCSRVNPADASYCYFDGAVLNGHAGDAALLTGGKQSFPREFVFPSGKAVRNFDQLAKACQEDWAGTLDLLQQGYLERFLGETGRADLALAAREAARFPDRDRGLDQFLAKLPTDVLEPPKLYAEPSNVNLGLLQVGDDRHLQLKLSNQGSRLLYGSVTSDAKWLTVGDAPGAPSKLFQFGDEATIPIHIRGKELRASNKPLEGHLSIESNGGTVTTTVRAEVPIKPFKEGVLAGATSPRQIAEKAKAKPKEAAPLFENGAVGKWYKDNGWTYPVQGPATSGLAAVAQFFEALGLARPPKVEISERSVRLRGSPGEKLKYFLKVESQEKRPVYAHGSSDSPWVEVGRAQLQGRAATVAVVVPRVPNQPGEILQARVTVTSNGNQQFDVPVTLEISGQRMASPDVEPILPVQAGYAAAAPVPLMPVAGQDDGLPVAVMPRVAQRRKGGFFSANLHLWPAVLLALLLGGFFVHDLFKGNKLSGLNLKDTTPRITLQFHDHLIDAEEAKKAGGVTPDGSGEGTTGLTLPTMRAGLLMKDPDNPQEYKKLTYDKWGRSNNTCVRLDGDEYLIGVPPGSWKEMKADLGKQRVLVKQQPKEIDREGARSVWLLEDGKVQITQIVEIVPGSQSRVLDTCLIRYTIENKDSKKHNVGLRFLLDTYIGANDGVPFTIPGADKLSDTMQEFTSGKDLPDFIQALEKEDLKDPGTVARVTFKVKDLETPGRVLLGAWPGPKIHARDKRALGHMTKWEVPLQPMNIPELKFHDSAVTMYWAEQDLMAGEKRAVGFTYGLGSIAGSGRIRLTVGGSFEPGGTLTLTALVNNPKPDEKVTLTVPKGFKIEGDAAQLVPQLEPGASSKNSPVTWKVRTVKEEGDYDLNVKSSTGDEQSETVRLQAGRSIFD